MSDRAALIRAVLDNPEDDTPRLVFADWLEEHGAMQERARASFIRFQIEAEKVPLANGERERSEPYRRAASLLAEHGEHWRKQVRTYDGLYSRGFLCIDRSPHEFAKDVRRLLAVEPAEVSLKLDAMATLRGPDPLQNRRIELALRALCEIGEPAKAAGPQLRALASATDQQLLLVREPCLVALGKVRPDPKEDLTLLKEMLGVSPPYKDAPPALNRGAAQAIWDYGPGAKELAPVLLKRLSSKEDIRDFETRWRCLRALPAIGAPSEDAVPVLMQYLASQYWSDYYYSLSAAAALTAYGPRAKAAVAPARECLDSPSPEVRAQACRLLAAIGPDAKAALPDLRELTYDESPEVRDAARAAIKTLGK